jgi:hypothetical protein
LEEGVGLVGATAIFIGETVMFIGEAAGKPGKISPVLPLSLHYTLI